MENFATFCRRMSPMKVILLGYCLIILAGGILLTLPIAARDGVHTPFSDALFTATSATCVTGLIRFDTYSHWSYFGQAVILTLIQVGGIGFMTFAVSVIALTKRKIGLASRVIMQNSISAPQVGGIVRLTRFIIAGTALIEGVGALLLSFYFVPRKGLGEGLWFSVFHSISAFCNAGFDLLGSQQPFSSLTGLAGNWYVNLIIMLLIVVGGLGFFVWSDMVYSKFRFSRLKLQSKLVLTVSALLIFAGAAALYFLELGNPEFVQRPADERVLTSLFQSVTARTAGFNSVDLAQMTQSSRLLMICLMLIGGSAGSTAGGIKTTTFAVLVISVISVFKKKKSVEAFGRRMEDGIVRRASCIFMTYLFLTLFVAMAVSSIDGFPILDTLFESASAVGTVGLTTGITTELSLISKTLVGLLMLIGRVGSITLLLAFSSDRGAVVSKLPLEKIQVG